MAVNYSMLWDPAAAAAQEIIGLLVLGDSGADEYQADDNRGGAYHATTFNWLELLVIYRGINCGPWGTRASPRRTGYEYNWALSADRLQDLIGGGQHTGGAAQVAAGLVSHALIDCGANDFTNWNNTYTEIYDGSLNDAGVATKVSTFVSQMTTAVDTLLAAGDVKIVVTNRQDRGTTPAFIAQYPNSSGRARVTAAIQSVNSGLDTMASTRPNVVIQDDYNFGATILSQIDENGFYHIGGELIDIANYGDEPHHLLLGDNEHVGTVMSGVRANSRIAKFNSSFGTAVPLFTDAEIIANAGIT